MTPEQRERMEFYAGRGTQLAIAVRAALVEIDALRADRERLEKLDLWAEMPDEWARASGKRWSWSWSCSNDEYDTLREAIDARVAKEEQLLNQRLVRRLERS